jgi:hypothetical protein
MGEVFTPFINSLFSARGGVQMRVPAFQAAGTRDPVEYIVRISDDPLELCVKLGDGV